MTSGPGEYYPGSRERRQAARPWEGSLVGPSLEPGRVLTVNGIEVEFFSIGQLAAALGRKPVTIRSWEAEGILPTSGWTKPGRDRDPRGRRRLWTRAQVEGIWRIALEEGVLAPGPSITATRFTQRVRSLFAQLRKEGIR